MIKNRRLARAISECGFGLLRTLVESKAAQHEGREVRVINRWQPTSQVCSECGYRWGKLDLSVRSIPGVTQLSVTSLHKTVVVFLEISTQ